MNKKIYIANWKMNITSKEANSFFEKFLPLYKTNPGKEVVFCPSFTTLVSSVQAGLLKDLDQICFVLIVIFMPCKNQIDYNF